MNDEDEVRKKVAHEIGEALDALSIEELNARIGVLEEEIERLRTAMKAKRVTRSAAEAFFKS